MNTWHLQHPQNLEVWCNRRQKTHRKPIPPSRNRCKIDLKNAVIKKGYQPYFDFHIESFLSLDFYYQKILFCYH